MSIPTDAISQVPGNTPQFSVVIPTYNRAGTIGDTLRACLVQSCDDFELVVVDDGSTDATEQAVAALDDPRIVYVRQANAGPAAARNRGVREASGSHIAFLDSDDVWQPHYLASVAEAMVTSAAVRAVDASRGAADEAQGDKADRWLIYSQLIVDRGVGRYWNKPHRGIGEQEAIYDYLYVYGGFIQTSTLVLPRRLARELPWDEAVTFGDNDQFVIDCWQAGLRFHYVPLAMTRYEDAFRSDALSQLPLHDKASARYLNFFAWMKHQEVHMSVKARHAFGARFESVLHARRAPLRSLKLVFVAWRCGAMSLPGAARQLVQNFAPRQYRRLTDLYVRWRGLPWAEAAADPAARSRSSAGSDDDPSGVPRPEAADDS